MYNLLVSGNPAAWDDTTFSLENSRCMEYTSADIQQYFYRFGETRIDEIMSYPTIFAYETPANRAPHLGKIVSMRPSGRDIRGRIEIHQAEFIPHDRLVDLRIELDIDDFEFHRTHWAIKRVELGEELAKQGICVSNAANSLIRRPHIDLETFAFPVALSFPGATRHLVADIASRLEQRLGLNSCFYDYHYQAYLARPGLDVLLQSIYSRASLNVVFLSGHYQQREWCGLEWRKIRESIQRREFERVMFVRTDDGDVEGVTSGDGYIDATRFTTNQIAFFIEERARACATMGTRPGAGS